MARLLVISSDRKVPYLTQEQSWCKGDLVAAFPDDHEFGYEEKDTRKFWIVDVPGVPPTDFDFMRVPLRDAQGNHMMRCQYTYNPDQKRIDRKGQPGEAYSIAGMVQRRKVLG